MWVPRRDEVDTTDRSAYFALPAALIARQERSDARRTACKPMRGGGERKQKGFASDESRICG